MKKMIFTLFAFLACFMGANAVEVVDLEIDNNFTSLGWQSDSAKERVSIQDGIVCFSSSEAVDPFYDVQFQLPQVPGFDQDATYTITLKIKGTGGTIHGGFSGSNNVDISVTSDWQTVVLEGCVNNPDNQYWAGSGAFLIQCGDYVGDWQISYLKITHEERDNQQPKVWIPLAGFENGDAETPWADPNVGALDAENNYKICAWGKENSGDPHPALIEEEEGNPSNHVFVVKAGKYEANPWDNQFWIMAPREIKDGEKFKISFRYKASENVTRGIQGHGFPSEYRNNFNIGATNGLAFTTEWQTYEWEGSWQNVWSIVWNLNEEGDNEVTYYFDDISIQELKLDHGWFVAGANTETGAVEYDFDNAIEFTPEDPYLVATVGTVGKNNTWVNEVMISTVRGDDGSFQTATIKPSTQNITSGEEDFVLYGNGSRYKIKLPAQGVWKIILYPSDEESGYIAFVQLEGDAIVVKDPVDIITYKDEIVIEAVEREPTSQEQPADAEAGIEAGTGNTWDNQFFIYSTRDLAPGEETIIEFEYKATNPARSTGAFQGIVAGNQDYITGAFNLENDDIFDTEWKSIKKELTMPEKKWDGTAVDVVQYITFDLACIKEANTYTFRNIKWYLKDDTLNEQNKTLENLINEDGSANFAIKVGAGTNPEFTGIESVVSDKKASNVTYNLAGQRVSKGYKGIVIKNGAKYIAK